MLAEVVIEAAGDHALDLAHLRREGGAELVAEIERLDAEARELSKLVGDPPVQALIQDLVRVTKAAGGARAE